MCVVPLFFCALLFAFVAQAAELGQAYQAGIVTSLSIGLFAFATISSGLAVVLSEV